MPDPGLIHSPSNHYRHHHHHRHHHQFIAQCTAHVDINQKQQNHRYQKCESACLENGMSDPSLISSSSSPLPLLSFLSTVKLIPGHTRIYRYVGWLRSSRMRYPPAWENIECSGTVKTHQNMQKHLG